jgi:hypoxanthine phosphoribosyltransferase
MSDLYVSWSEYHKKIEALAVKIYQSGWKFNQIVCIAKGGLRIGDTLSRLFRQPLAIISAVSYGGEDNQKRGTIKFSSHISLVNERLGDRVLLVDDLVDSGTTLEKTIQWLNFNFYEDIQEIKTAVIWHKNSSIFIPDYYIEYLADNPWIHQPFEKYEQITPADLESMYSIS